MKQLGVWWSGRVPCWYAAEAYTLNPPAFCRRGRRIRAAALVLRRSSSPPSSPPSCVDRALVCSRRGRWLPASV
eukprot:7008478-Prymnesium_polylepis.1